MGRFINLKYFKTLRYFGEDQSRIKFEDFFSMWSTFLISFNETKFDLKVRKRRSEEEFQRKQKEELNVKIRPKSIQIPTIETTGSLDNGEFLHC